MGHNLKVLVSKQISRKSELAPTWFQTELGEEFHLHIREVRFIFGTKEYEIFCKGIAQSYQAWSDRNKESPRKGLCVRLHKLDGLPEEPEFDADLFQIELQDPAWEGDMIHLHYRNLRLYFRREEFKQYAQVICEALKSLNEYESQESKKQT